MKKVVSILLAAVLTVSCVFALSGCSKKGEGKFELAMITDGAPVNDGGYNEYTWNGVKSYAEEKGITCRYYQPNVTEEGELEVETVSKYIELAVKNGAKQIVLPGEKFSVSAYEIAPTYKDVQFFLIDAYPHSEGDSAMRLQANVECIRFNKLQAGFLAGYSAFILGSKDDKGKLVRKYNTKHGFLGSVNNQDTADYGAGYIQGVAYAADQKSVPSYIDFAEYDNPYLNYDYSFTIKPVYVKRDEAKKKTFKVNVIDGIGSGVYTDGENVTITANPAPAGKKFDHWEVKSDTDGVKDKKVNISSKKETSMNLLVGDCDCTIKAVWEKADTVPVVITEYDGTTPHETINAEKDSTIWVEAPAANSGYVFDRWKTSDEKIVENIEEKGTNVTVSDKAITLTPVYVKSESPTFDLKVENGTGSGSYVKGDEVKVVAQAPQDGYMFYKWENVDNQGLSTGIAMDNEYCYHATFEMVDRYASIVEKMYDDGTQIVFAGGNEVSESIFDASGEFDYKVYTFGSGIDEGSKNNCLASVVTDYGNAIKLALGNFNGGQIFTGDIANDCIYVTNISLNEYQLDDEGKPKEDKDGNKIKDDNYNADYAALFNDLKENKVKMYNAEKGADVRNLVKESKCLTVNYWVK